jgi:hypothetical protein
VVKDIEGNIAEDDAIITTGMSVELISKGDASVVNEKVAVVVSGDVDGDGLVTDEDYDKAVDMCMRISSYTDEEKAFFTANDTDGDGVLDVIDLFNISNMSYGNY